MAGSDNEVPFPAGKENLPLFSFGMIADVQYADIENRWNYSHTKMRYYRNSLVLLREAVAAWKASGEHVDFIVQLGDFLDGFNTEKGRAESDASCALLFEELKKSGVPVHHVIGNHELYNYNRKELYERGFLSGYELSKNHLINVTNSSSSDYQVNGVKKITFKSYCKSLNVRVSHYPSYYHIRPCRGFKFIFLDTYDLSVHGYNADSERHKKSLAFLRKWNKNEEWNSPVGLGNKRHIVAFNGGVGDEQLSWLRKQLEDASQQKEKVIMFAHVPIYRPASDAVCLAWNHEEVLDIIHQFTAVEAVFCGHSHAYGYARDNKDIHHVVLPGIVEVPPGQNGYATVDVYNDRLHVRGAGKMKTLHLDI